MRQDASPLLRYGLAASLAALALLLTYLLPFLWGAPSLLFLAAVIIATATAGPGPGLLAGLLSALAINSVLHEPPFTFRLSTGDLFRGAVFLGVVWLVVRITTDRKQGLDAARAERERLGTTLASIGDAVIATDAGGRVTFINPVAQALTGWTEAEAAGRPLGEVFQILDESTRKFLESPVPRAMRHGAPLGLAEPSLLVARSGSELPIAATAAPIRGVDGEALGVVLVFRDTAGARRAADEREQLLHSQREALREREEAIEQHRRMEEQLTLLMQASGALSARLDTHAVLAGVLDLSKRLIAADAYAIWRYRAHNGQWGIAAAEGLSEEYQRSTIQVLATTPSMPADPVIAEDVQQATLLSDRRDGYLREGIRSLLAVPLVIHGERCGTLTLYYRTPHPFTDAEVRLATALANLSASALGTTELYEEQTRLRAEAQDAAQRIRSVVDHVVDGIITIDERGTIETWNPAAARIFGYSAGEVVGQNVKMLMPEPYHGQHDDYLAAYLRTGQAKVIGIGREVVGRRKDGSIFPLDLAVSEFRLGERRFFTGIVRDVTERKRMQEALEQRADELAERDRRKDEFLAMLAHELRNPLAPIRNALYLLQAVEGDAEAGAQVLAIMERQVEHLVRLVDDLLDVARIMRGKVALRKEPIDLATVVRRAIETARPLIEAEEHALTVTLPEGPLLVEGDQVRLAQVVGNLLNNSAKYTDRGGHIGLTVFVEEVSSQKSEVSSQGTEAKREDSSLTPDPCPLTPGEVAVVRVRDDGIGISADVLPHVFDLFVQGVRPVVGVRAQGGLGIGLTLVQRLVELHGGRVEAFSEGPGRGSEFVVRLPLLPPHTVRPSASPDESLDEDALPCHRVLVVDDSVDAARSLSLLLRLWKQDVRTAPDGPSALEVVDAFRPEVAILDIG
ncbi:MAG: PAS domain S-box protein, partial [Planctomycetes bacterium]|nr:PAS domain S-box protein [Planctomycetota bacterium]